MKKKQLTVRLIALVLMAMLCLVGCKQEPEEPSTENTEYLVAYQQYVKSVLDANYHADYEDYMAITGATEDQASKIIEAHAVTLAQQLADWYDIHLEQLPAEIGDTLIDICTEIYLKSKYSVTNVEKVGETVYVTVVVEPMEYLEDAAGSVATYTSEFNDRAKAGEFEKMTESQYENEYAKGLLEVLDTAVDKIGYGDKVTHRVTILYNAQTGVNYIGEEDLNEINQLILAD